MGWAENRLKNGGIYRYERHCHSSEQDNRSISCAGGIRFNNTARLNDQLEQTEATLVFAQLEGQKSGGICYFVNTNTSSVDAKDILCCKRTVGPKSCALYSSALKP